MSIRVEHLHYIYGEGTAFSQYALKDVNFTIEQGEFVGLIGHTGSGKSTLIQHLNGLLKPTKGTVYYNDEDIFGDGYDRKSLRRQGRTGIQYPEYQLFEVDVFTGRYVSGLRIWGWDKDEIERRARKALELVAIG